jgi:hypothetical protein
MNQQAKDMIKTLKKIAKKHNLKIGYENFKGSTLNGKKIKSFCYKLIDTDVEEKYNSLLSRTEKLCFFNLPNASYIVMTYTVTNDIGNNYFEFTPDDISCTIAMDLDLTQVNKITTEAQFDLKYKDYKKRFDDYYSKYDLAIKQEIMKMALERADSDFNDKPQKSEEDDFFERLANI